MNTIVRLTLIVLSLSLFSCGRETDADKIGSAQFCLDDLGSSGTPAQVSECVAMVDGLTSPGADGIRCSGGFIREGFGNPQKYIDAFREIEGGTGGGNIRNMMGLLSFTSGGAIAADFTTANSVFLQCLASGAKGRTLLSSFAFFTVGLVQFFHAKNAGGCAGTPSGSPAIYDLDGCVQSANPLDLLSLADANSGDTDAAAAQTAIGSVIVSTYQLSCTGTGANKDLCGLLEDAVTAAGGVSNPRAVAAGLFTSIVQ